MSKDFQPLPSLQPRDGGGQGWRSLMIVALFMGFFLFSQRFWAPPPAPPAPPQAPAAPPLPAAPSAEIAAPAPGIPVETVDLKGGDLEATVTNEGAGISRLVCLRNPGASVLYDSGLYAPAKGVPPLLALRGPSLPWATRWRLAAHDASSARFELALPGGLSLAKTLRLPDKGYLIEAALDVVNGGSAPAAPGLQVLVPSLTDAEAGPRSAQSLAVLLANPKGGSVLKSVSVSALIADHDPASPWRPKDPWPAHWAGMADGYFVAMAQVAGEAAAPEAWPVWSDPAAVLDRKKRDPLQDHAVGALALPAWTLAPGETGTALLRCYAGPKDAEVLAAADPRLPQVMDRGFLDVPILATLRFLRGLSGNYGLAIILLTLLVRAAIHPLNRAAQVSMMTSSEKMKRLQPRLEELKKRYKGNARKLMEEQTRVMKEEGMSPFSTLGGCLPILLQMPVLIALYRVLQGAIELRGAPFALWIRDLARPDTVVSGLPFVKVLNPLPIALIAVTVYQMWRAPKPADPQMAQQQKMMMVIMPVMFGFMFYSLPSGITLYWFTSTVFSIGEQWYIRRLLVARGVIKKASGASP